MKKVTNISTLKRMGFKGIKDLYELIEITEMDSAELIYCVPDGSTRNVRQKLRVAEGLKWLKDENSEGRKAFVKNKKWLERRRVIGIQGSFSLDNIEEIQFLRKVSHASVIKKVGLTKYSVIWFVFHEDEELHEKLTNALIAENEGCKHAKVITYFPIQISGSKNWDRGEFAYEQWYKYQPLTLVEFVLKNSLNVWVPPAELNLYEGSSEALPIDVLPRLMQETVKNFSKVYCCPPEFAFVPLVTMIGSVIGHKIHVKPRKNSDLVIAPNFWAISIGDSGAGKFPVHLRMREFFGPLNDKASMDYDDANKRYGAQQKIEKIRERISSQHIKQRIIAIDKILDPIEKRKMEELLASEVTENSRQPQKPSLVRYTTNKATYADLQRTLGENHNGILMDLEDLKGFIHQLRGSKGFEYRSFLLECNSGFGQHDIDRLNTGTTYASNMLLSIFATTKPSVVYPHIRNTLKGSEENDGLWQRFNILLHPKTTDNVSSASGEVEVSLISKVQSLFCSINQCDFGFQPNLGLKERSVCLSERALGVYKQWYREITSFKSKKDVNDVYQNYLLKYKTLVPKLALLFEVVESFDDANQVIGPIKSVSETSAKKAVRIAKFLESHARHVFDVRTNIDTANAILILKRIDRLPPKFSARDIAQKNWSGLNTNTDEVNRAIMVLESALVIRKVTNCRQKPLWEVNTYITDPGAQ